MTRQATVARGARLEVGMVPGWPRFRPLAGASSDVRTHRRTRQGAVLVLAAVLMTILFTFVAFSVDIGYVVVANAELQNAADAAALAGAASIRQGPSQARAAPLPWRPEIMRPMHPWP